MKLLRKKSPMLYVLLGLFSINQAMPMVYAADSPLTPVSKDERAGFQFEKDPNTEKVQEWEGDHKNPVDLDDVIAAQIEKQESETGRKLEFWKEGEERQNHDLSQFAVANDYKRKVILSSTRSDEETDDKVLFTKEKGEEAPEAVEQIILMTHGILKWNPSENHGEYLHKREDGTVKKFDYHDLQKHVMNRISCSQPFMGNTFNGSICTKTEEVNKKGKLSFDYIDDYVEMRTPVSGEIIAFTGKSGFKEEKIAIPVPAKEEPLNKKIVIEESTRSVNTNPEIRDQLQERINKALLLIEQNQEKAKAKQMEQDALVEIVSIQIDGLISSFRSSLGKVESMKNQEVGSAMKTQVEEFIAEANQYLENQMSSDLENFFDIKTQKIMFYDEVGNALQEQAVYLEQMKDSLSASENYEQDKMRQDIKDMENIVEQTVASIFTSEEEEQQSNDGIVDRLKTYTSLSEQLLPLIKQSAVEFQAEHSENEKQKNEKEARETARILEEQKVKKAIDLENNEMAERNQKMEEEKKRLESERLLEEQKIKAMELKNKQIAEQKLIDEKAQFEFQTKVKKVRENLMIFNAMADERSGFDFVYDGKVKSYRFNIPDFLDRATIENSAMIDAFNQKIEADAESLLMNIELNKKNIQHVLGEIKEKESWYQGMSRGLAKWTENLSIVRDEMKNKLSQSENAIEEEKKPKTKEKIESWHLRGVEGEKRLADIQDKFSELALKMKADTVTVKTSYYPLQFSGERSRAFDFIQPTFSGVKGYLGAIKANQEVYRTQIDGFKNEFSDAIKDYRAYLAEEKNVKVSIDDSGKEKKNKKIENAEEKKRLEQKRLQEEQLAKAKQMEIEKRQKEDSERLEKEKKVAEEKATETARLKAEEIKRIEKEIEVKKLEDAKAQEAKRIKEQKAQQERERLEKEKVENLRLETLEKERMLELERQKKIELEKQLVERNKLAEQEKRKALEQLSREKEIERERILEERANAEKLLSEEVKRKEIEMKKLEEKKQFALKKMEEQRRVHEKSLLDEKTQQEKRIQNELKEQEDRLRAEFETRLMAQKDKPNKAPVVEVKENKVLDEEVLSSISLNKKSRGVGIDNVAQMKDQILKKASRYYELELQVRDKVLQIENLIKQRDVLALDSGKERDSFDTIQTPQVIFGSKQNIKSFIDELKRTSDPQKSGEWVERIRSRSDYLMSNLKELIYVQQTLDSAIASMLDESLQNRKDDGSEIELLLARN